MQYLRGKVAPCLSAFRLTVAHFIDLALVNDGKPGGEEVHYDGKGLRFYGPPFSLLVIHLQDKFSLNHKIFKNNLVIDITSKTLPWAKKTLASRIYDPL